MILVDGWARECSSWEQMKLEEIFLGVLGRHCGDIILIAVVGNGVFRTLGVLCLFLSFGFGFRVRVGGIGVGGCSLCMSGSGIAPVL